MSYELRSANPAEIAHYHPFRAVLPEVSSRDPDAMQHVYLTELERHHRRKLPLQFGIEFHQSQAGLLLPEHLGRQTLYAAQVRLIGFNNEDITTASGEVGAMFVYLFGTHEYMAHEPSYMTAQQVGAFMESVF